MREFRSDIDQCARARGLPSLLGVEGQVNWTIVLLHVDGVGNPRIDGEDAKNVSYQSL